MRYVKSAQIQSFFWSEYWKIRTRRNPYLDTFLAVMATQYFDFTSGAFQLDPGPKDKSSSAFSICHRNLNSITAHNYAKVLLLEAYIAVLKFDIVCISQTYLDSSRRYDDGNLEITGYNLITILPSMEYKGGSFCICYKNLLSLRVLSIYYFQECFNFRLKIGEKLCNSISLYRSPSQTQDEFKKNF